MSASRVRDAMIPEPLTLDVSASAQEAGQHLVEPDVRAVYVSEGGRFAGVLTRKTLVERVVAARARPRRDTRGGEDRGAAPTGRSTPSLPARRGRSRRA
jgi:CBS domain-containing protein